LIRVISFSAGGVLLRVMVPVMSPAEATYAAPIPAMAAITERVFIFLVSRVVSSV
jgi:hypothetical protein